MIYSIQEYPAFSVIGQEIGMTNYQRENLKISKQFWKQFNANLKKSYLAQSGNWFGGVDKQHPFGDGNSSICYSIDKL